MKRWDINQMLATSRQLFAKVMKRKRLAHHNHDIHFLAREVENWLPQGIQSLLMPVGIFILLPLQQDYLNPLQH